jgi:putative holliday junction resolvase
MNQSNQPNYSKFNDKCLLSIDYGSKIVGLASTKVGIDPYPTPFGRIIYNNDLQVCQELMTIIEDECVDIVILGLPRYEDGNDSDMTKRVKNFAESLKTHLRKELFFFQDETYSSYEAENRMKTSAQHNFRIDLKQIDALAACIILEDFLKADFTKFN